MPRSRICDIAAAAPAFVVLRLTIGPDICTSLIPRSRFAGLNRNVYFNKTITIHGPKPQAKFAAKWGKFVIDPMFLAQLVYQGV
ncbi:hypothetical protein GGE67_000107 [Rhizobium leucaenae]|uniref:Uncharacterized protein n=1 Tax=Rhizobium leucaenae TaxID=29450 RepID=A0A7W6ZVI6_9HYPH|nr:hypothetical protein [Rhizobium leucaenae]MBB6299514.1 hypothetical protein [Rhizobium leucaenae]